MGLDIIAYKEYKNGEHVPADNSWFTGTEQLSRGVMGGDMNWLRGKVYDHLIEQVSGISLYQETINNDVVKKISDSLKEFNNDPRKFPDIAFYYNFTKAELKQLEKWFNTAAEKGCYLHGWW